MKLSNVQYNESRDNQTLVATKQIAANQSEAAIAPSAAGSSLTAIKTVPIAAHGEYITDALFDSVANHIYVSDTQGQITILDGTDYTVLQILDGWGYFTLDAKDRRLYVTPGRIPLPEAVEPSITVMTLGQSCGELPTISGRIPGRSMSIDSANNSLYVHGSLEFGQPDINAADIREYDSQTLSEIDRIYHRGHHVYSAVVDNLTPTTAVEPRLILDTLPNGKLIARDLAPSAEGHLLRIVQSAKEEPALSQSIKPSSLLGYEVAQIIPAPTFGASSKAVDQTVFVRTEHKNGLFRSQDGVQTGVQTGIQTEAQTWELIDIGLSWDLFEGMSIQLSPDFANDETLFIASPNVRQQGFGVWRSTDSGDTWQPCHHGLDDLRIASLFISPQFGNDQSIIAQTIEGQIYRTTNAGDEWLHMAASQQEGTFDNLGRFLTDEPETMPCIENERDPLAPFVRIDYLMNGGLVYQTLAERLNNSNTWTLVPIKPPLLPSGFPQYWSQVFTAPTDPWTVYAISDRAICRTLDGGVTWVQLSCAGLQRLPQEARLRSAAIVGDPFGAGTSLMVGTSHGEVWLTSE